LRFQTELPPRPEVKRGYPLSPGQWSRHMDKEGYIHDLSEIMEVIFKGVRLLIVLSSVYGVFLLQSESVKNEMEFTIGETSFIPCLAH
jgi:hypothetical protein